MYELLQVTDSIRELIVARATHHEIRALAIEEGMRTMQAQAFELVVDGKTTIDDVIRSVYAPGVDRDDAKDPLELPAGKRALGKAPGELGGADQGPEARTMSNEPHDPISMGSGMPGGPVPNDLGDVTAEAGSR